MAASIANIVAEYRRQHGMSLEEMSSKIGIAKRSLLLVEQGRIKLYIPMFLKIARFLSLDPLEFLDPCHLSPVSQEEQARRHQIICKTARARRKQLGIGPKMFLKLAGESFDVEERERGGPYRNDTVFQPGTIRILTKHLSLPEEYFDTLYRNLFGCDPDGWICLHCGSVYSRYRIRCSCPNFTSEYLDIE